MCTATRSKAKYQSGTWKWWDRQGRAPEVLLLRELYQLEGIEDPPVAQQMPRAAAGITNASRQLRVMLRSEPARRHAARPAPPPLSGAPKSPPVLPPPSAAAGATLGGQYPGSAVNARRMAVSKGDCGSG